MSFCDLLIGSAMHRLAPSRQRFALTAESAISNHPSCSLVQTDVTSSFRGQW